MHVNHIFVNGKGVRGIITTSKIFIEHEKQIYHSFDVILDVHVF